MELNPLSVVFDHVGGMCFDSSSLTIHVFRFLQSNHIPDVCGFYPHLCLTHCYFNVEFTFNVSTERRR